MSTILIYSSIDDSAFKNHKFLPLFKSLGYSLISVISAFRKAQSYKFEYNAKIKFV